ncbi:MAG TPA: hypothetical protein VFC99_00380 [Acidimicrobiia bacterium]|nr:hypothetical protein [Acidimicrobiia bacterium]
MRPSRLAALAFGSALAVGGFASTALAGTDDASHTTPAATAASTEAETDATTAGGPVTLTVAGVGTVTLTVDPTTAAISDVVVTPIDGVTTGAPVATPEGVKIQVTASDGTVRVLEIKARHDDAKLEVEAELEVENEAEQENEQQGEAGDDNGAGKDRGRHEGEVRGSGDAEHETTPTTGAAPGVFAPTPSGGDQGDSGRTDGSGRDGSGGDHSGGDSGGHD